MAVGCLRNTNHDFVIGTAKTKIRASKDMREKIIQEYSV